MLVEEIKQIALNVLQKEENKTEYEHIAKYALQHDNNNFFIDLITMPDEIISTMSRLSDNVFRDTLAAYTDLVFMEIAHKVPELKSQVFSFIQDFNKVLDIMLLCLRFLSPNTPSYMSFKLMMQAFGQALADDKSGASILFLENVGLDYILKFAKEFSNKKDTLVHIIMSICPPNQEMRLRILYKIDSILGPDYKTLSGILAHTAAYDGAEGFDGKILDFYWTKAFNILGNCSAKMKANGLKILNEISRYNYTKMSTSYSILRSLCSDIWWEVKAQILIICANQLELIELAGQEEQSGQYNKSNVHVTQEHGEETVEAAIPMIDPENQSQQFEQTEKNPRSNENRSQINDFDKTQESRLGQALEGSDFALQKKDMVASLIDIVERIFHFNANVNVQKIGLIYLAKILNYYPQLCQGYLDVLLSVDDDVRETVLDIDPENQGEYYVVLSKILC